MELPSKNYESGKYWTDGVTLVQGCTKVSPGCDHCWSEGWAKRYGVPFSQVTFRQDRLNRLLRGGASKVVAICNDLFHEDVSTYDIWETLAQCEVYGRRHTFMILTKRAERMRPIVNERLRNIGQAQLGENIWLGVTVEDQYQAENRMHNLMATRASRRFVCVEPILGPLDLNSIDTGGTWPFRAETSKLNALAGHASSCREVGGARFIDVDYKSGLDWVIVACETGPGARINGDTVDHIRDVVEQCKAAGVPCWVKAVPVKFCANYVASKNMDRWPEDLRVREVPE